MLRKTDEEKEVSDKGNGSKEEKQIKAKICPKDRCQKKDMPMTRETGVFRESEDSRGTPTKMPEEGDAKRTGCEDKETSRGKDSKEGDAE